LDLTLSTTLELPYSWFNPSVFKFTRSLWKEQAGGWLLNRTQAILQLKGATFPFFCIPKMALLSHFFGASEGSAL
jgi:hypothetical protein